MPRKKVNGVGSCAVEGCPHDIMYIEAELCRNCYQAMYYWRDRSPTDVMKRQKQLVVLENRMELMSGNRPRAKR